MAYNSIKELARTTVYEVGKKRKPERRWVITLGDNTLLGTPFLEAELVGTEIDLFQKHPVYTDYRVRKITLVEGYEGSPYHVLATAEYDLIFSYEKVEPTSRDAVWSAESSGGEVPALSYYDGSTLRPLTNSAGDYFPGLVTQESEVILTFEKNYASWPSSLVNSQNNVNGDVYAGCPVGTLKVASVSVVLGSEESGGATQRYWKAVAKIHYRQSGHNLQLPDIGWNVISGNQKQRAMVFDFQNSEWLPSANPIALNGSGAAASIPAILNRRVNPETNFLSLFGVFPTTPPLLVTTP